MTARALAVLLYALVLLGIGVVASRRTRTLSDYIAGGKRVRFFAAAFSARATGESAWLLLGLTGFGAAFGLLGLWVVVGEVLGVALAWMLMSRRFKRLCDRYGALTVPDYLEARFRGAGGAGGGGDAAGHGLRWIAAGALLVFVPIYVSAQIHATGEAFSAFLGWNYYAGALFGFGIVVLYITRGGFIAVVWSDVFQGLMMVGGLVTLPLVGLAAAGGWGPVAESLAASFPTHLDLLGGESWSAATAARLVGLLAIGLGFLGSPQVFVRFIAMRSEAEIRPGTWVAVTWTLLADTGAVLVGIVGRALLEGDLGPAGQEVLPRLVDALLHPFLAGLFIAIVLSAIMSTIDSLLVVASSAAVRDVYQKIIRPDLTNAEVFRWTSRLTLALSAAALALALGIALATGRQPIFWFVIFGWSGIAATFCPTVILSLAWPGFTRRGAQAAMVAGFVSVPVFKFLAPALPGVGPIFANLEEMAPSFVVSALVGVLVSLADREGRRRLEGVAEELTANAPEVTAPR